MNKLDTFTHSVGSRVLAADKLNSAHVKIKRFRSHLDHTMSYTLTDLGDEGIERIERWMGKRLTQLGALQIEIDRAVDQSYRFIARINGDRVRRHNAKDAQPQQRTTDESNTGEDTVRDDIQTTEPESDDQPLSERIPRR